MNKKIFYGEIPQEKLRLNTNEVAARLEIPKDYSNDLVDMCEIRLRKELKCGYSAILTDVTYGKEYMIDLGFGFFESKSLWKNLNETKQAYVFATTIGYGADRLINKLAVSSIAEYFITDALASSFAEAACDYAESLIKENIKCRPRFSPGYGDLPLHIQPQVLDMVSAGKYLNITVNKSLLMSPSKSITAVMGVWE